VEVVHAPFPPVANLCGATEPNLSQRVACSRICEQGSKREEIPDMKKIIYAAALFGASALSAVAQTAPAATTNGNTPAVATPDSKNTTAPVEGANSFTESQAKSRIEKAGYADIKDLKKDDKGIWMASGMKDGKPVMIALDYQGNVVAK
jgi:hypothetical protein